MALDRVVRTLSFSTLIIFLGFSIGASAPHLTVPPQEAQQPSSQGDAFALVDGIPEHRIGRNDLLHITVWNGLNVEETTVRVAEDGTGMADEISITLTGGLTRLLVDSGGASRACGVSAGHGRGGESQRRSSVSDILCCEQIAAMTSSSFFSIRSSTSILVWRRSTVMNTRLGTTLREFGYASITPVVVRAPSPISPARRFTATMISAAATDASLRIFIGVVPA